MSKYKAILFDLDGTLRANQPEGFQAFIEYASRVGIALSEHHIQTCERAVHQYWADGAQVFDHLARYDERGFWVNYNRLLLVAMGVPHTIGDAEKIQDQFGHYEPQNVVYADVPFVLESLRNTDHIVGLVSNRDNYYADIVGAQNVGMDAILIDPRDVFHGYYDKRVKTLLDVLPLIESMN
jgi:FMN phosphatase YigB (HAD superfamily)